jgi:cytoskeletal protein CcmA (bactofilin family)
MSDTPSQSSSVPADVEIHGSIAFGGDMTFAGKLTGGGIKGPTLTVSPGAAITGNVESETCTIHGTVKGDVMVTGKCDLKSSAILLGDLTTSRLAMGEGATFVGKADIRPERKTSSAPAPKTS